MDKITNEKLDKYFDVTRRALAKVKLAEEQKINWKEKAEDFLDMAKRYFEDAKHFREKGDITLTGGLMQARDWVFSMLMVTANCSLLMKRFK